MSAILNKNTNKYDLHYYVNGHQFTVRGFSTLKEAEFFENYQREVLSQKTKKMVSVTFHQVVKFYFDNVLSQRKLHTIYEVKGRVKRAILDHFPDKKYFSLEYDDFKSWFDYIESLSLVNKHVFLHDMKNIVECGRLYFSVDHSDFLKMLPLLKKEIIKTKQKNFYSLQEILKFLRYVKDPEMFLYFNVEGFLGTRRGETLGLLWGADGVDLEKRKITICHQVVTLSGKGPVLDSPKSTKSYRSLYMPDYLFKLFKAYRCISLTSKDGDFVFNERRYGKGKVRNRPLGTTTINRYRIDACMRANLPYITNHGFRHSFASVLESSGFSSQVISELLGHKTKTVTESVYLHSLGNEKDEVMKVFGRLIEEASIDDKNENGGNS